MKDSSVLWYKKPAEYWVQALPIGNGTLGGLIYGGVAQEKIALNHDELWTGHPKDTTRPGAAEAFKKAREMALDGKLKEAQNLIESDFQSTWSQAYMPLGDLIIDFDGDKYKNYRRSLDLNEAISYVDYEQGTKKIHREIFASNPDKVIAMRMTCDNGKFSMNVSHPPKTIKEMNQASGTILKTTTSVVCCLPPLLKSTPTARFLQTVVLSKYQMQLTLQYGSLQRPASTVGTRMLIQTANPTESLVLKGLHKSYATKM